MNAQLLPITGDVAMPTLNNLFTCQINEASNSLGPNRCQSNEDCQGERICSLAGLCEGESNCPIPVPTPTPSPASLKGGSCDINEAYNPRGPSRCWDDSECQGYRMCSYEGYCYGNSFC